MTFTPETIDPLATFDFEKITTRQLREGMILVDDLGCACAVLDHRIGSIGSGIIEWLIEDLDNGGWTKATFATTRIPTIKVATGIAA